MPKTTHKKDTPKKLINRREFMGAAAGAIVAPMIIPASARGADGHVAPSNRINVARSAWEGWGGDTPDASS